jgi:esterase
MTTLQRGTTALVGGPRGYPTFREMLDATAAASPKRSRESLRRGGLHNARRADDGRWVWRYDVMDRPMDFVPLWDAVDASRVPTLLVRGGDSFHTTEDDVAEFL